MPWYVAMLDNFQVILVRPQMGENIGASARAMLNCGFRNLRLVAPRDGWPSDRATVMSAGAFDEMTPVDVFETVEAAVADCHLVLATTARHHNLVKHVYTPEGAIAPIHQALEGGQRIGLLFGSERVGLYSEELAFAQGLITIPLNPQFSSLNLAQAVLIITYQIAASLHKGEKAFIHKGKTDIATQGEFDNFFKRFEAALDEAGFFTSPDMKPATVKNLKALLARLAPTTQELQTLHGVVTAFLRE
ncbi:MAG: TrmJ/YjtD family RNA methyltransferase [Alphaproteobacteria bacterium]|nr:TrmJ/YjtD family RNA methyltransferase [Alphaproteobacteria bacterium]